MQMTIGHLSDMRMLFLCVQSLNTKAHDQGVHGWWSISEGKTKCVAAVILATFLAMLTG